MSFATLDDYARITGETTGINEEIQAALDAACAEITAQTSQTFTYVMNDVIVVDGSGQRFLLLPQLPVVSVNEIWIDKELDTELQVEDFRVRGEYGIVYRREGWPLGVSNITVDYNHGYLVVPADVVNAAVQAARAGLTAPADDSTLTSETIGGYSYTRSSAVTVSANAVRTFAHVLDRYAVKANPVP